MKNLNEKKVAKTRKIINTWLDIILSTSYSDIVADRAAIVKAKKRLLKMK